MAVELEKDKKGHLYAEIENLRVTFIPANVRERSKNWSDSDVIRVQAYKNTEGKGLHRGAEFPVSGEEELEKLLVTIRGLYFSGNHSS